MILFNFDQGDSVCLLPTSRIYNRRAGRPRTVPLEMLDENTTYDARRYAELLADTSDTLTVPFGYTVRKSGGLGGI